MTIFIIPTTYLYPIQCFLEVQNTTEISKNGKPFQNTKGKTTFRTALYVSTYVGPYISDVSKIQFAATQSSWSIIAFAPFFLTLVVYLR